MVLTAFWLSPLCRAKGCYLSALFSSNYLAAIPAATSVILTKVISTCQVLRIAYPGGGSSLCISTGHLVAFEFLKSSHGPAMRSAWKKLKLKSQKAMQSLEKSAKVLEPRRESCRSKTSLSFERQTAFTPFRVTCLGLS